MITNYLLLVNTPLYVSLAVSPTTEQNETTVTVSWSPLITLTRDTFTYEVGYIARPDDTQCSTDVSDDVNVTLPDGFRLFGNTTGSSIAVTSLQPGTCYVFGVRVYSAMSEDVGEFVFTANTTLPLTSMSAN